jgi:hypothetical protein
MNGLKQMSLVLATAGLLTSGMAQAALHDRGGGLLYDDVLKVTWLQDANYAKTSGRDIDGLMNWTDANTWANSLNISRVAGESLTGWRLAANTPVGEDWNYDYSTDGTADSGWNITSLRSELSYMYYVNLELKAPYSTSGADQPNFGIFSNATKGGQANVELVKNLQSGPYWSGTAYAPDPAGVAAWGFDTNYGSQFGYGQNDKFSAWAVLPGDVAPVPEPETYAMLLAGLGLLGVGAKRRRRSCGAS